MARTAEVIYVGDASSLVRASAEAKAAVDSVNSSANNSKGLSSLPQLGGKIGTAFLAATPAVVGLGGALTALTASAAAAVGGVAAIDVGGIGALAAGFGSIALVAKPVATNFAAVKTALAAYNTTMANSSTTTAQASAALKTLNAAVAQNGGSSVLSAVQAWNSLGSSFKNLTGSARGNLFQSITDGLGTLKADLPTVAGIANSSMAALSKALQGPLTMLSGSSFQSSLKSLGSTFSQAIGPGVSAASKTFQAFTNIAVAAGPYVVQLAKGLDNMATSFLDATSNSKNLDGVIGSLVSQTKSWVALGGALTSLIFDVFKQGASSGQGLVNSLTGVLNKWDAWVQSAKGSADITNFFQESAAFCKQLFSALAPVVAALTSLSTGVLPVYVGLMSDLKGIMGPITDALVAYKVALVATTAATNVLKVAQTAWYALTTICSHAMDVYDVATLAWLATADDATLATKVWTAAQAALDVAMDANPIGAVVVGISALAAGVVYLATQTNFFSNAWKAIKSVVSDVASAVTSQWNKIKSTTISNCDAIKSAVTTAWNGVKNAVTNAVNTAASWLSTAWRNIKTTTGSAWSGVETTIGGAVKGASNTIKDTIGDVKTWLSGAWKDIANGVTTFASDIEDGITNAFKGAANDVLGFINDIIGVIDDLLSAVGVKKIDTIKGFAEGGTTSGTPTRTTTTGGFSPAAYAAGGKVNRPMFMVGEEAPVHPEYVIATNPAYKSRNMGLWAQAGHELGIPGFAFGGVIGGIESAASGVASTISGIVSGGASAIIGKLPGVGSLPSWLSGVGSSVLDDIGSWIKSKVSSVISSVGNALGLGGSGHPISGGGALSQPALESVWTSAGGPGGTIAHIAAAISDAESGGRPSAIQQGQPYATTGWGLWQITPGDSEPQFGINNALLTPLNNAKAAVAKYHDAGGFSPWTTYEDGAYKQFYAKGGTPGLKDDTSKINSAFSTLNSLMGPSGDYAAAGEKIGYYPSLWQITNSLLGSGASSFINTTDAAGNPIVPSINLSGLGITGSEETQELGWYQSQVADLRKSIPIATKIAPIIQDAIAKIRKEIDAFKRAAAAQIEALKKQIRANLAKMKTLSAQVTKAEGGSEPYPNAKNATQRAANAAWEKNKKTSVAGWRAQISSLETQNRKLGGTETTVGTGGQIGSVSNALTKQITPLQTKVTNLQSRLSSVTGSGSYSPMTLQGITGIGGELGPALLQEKTLKQELASISTGSVNTALKLAQQSYASGLATTATTATPTVATPVVAPMMGPTTTQELADLLAGMPTLGARKGAVLGYGGARATGGGVQPGYVYRVGENGPEDVAFGQPGTVMTAAQTRAAGGSNQGIINHGVINFTGATAAKATVDRLAYRAAIGVA